MSFIKFYENIGFTAFITLTLLNACIQKTILIHEKCKQTCIIKNMCTQTILMYTSFNLFNLYGNIF